MWISRIKSCINEQHGNALVLMSLALSALLCITGLVMDGGTIYYTRAHLQKVANASALSGAQELMNSTQAAEDVAKEVLFRHEETSSLKSITFNEPSIFEVNLEKDVSLNFAKLFGRDTVPVNATARAQYGNAGVVKGVAPIGIDERFTFQYMQEYELKTDTDGVDTGWFGVLALGGPGAATYYDNMRYGYSSAIRVGDVIETETGNIAGKTRTAVKERIDNCSYSFEEGVKRNCSRVILVPVYEPYEYDNQGQIKQVEIKGFAYFYITGLISSNDTAIRGLFLKRVVQGEILETAVDRGVYALRLVE
ncbi:hypothetical protein EJF36_05595 [Bacillus sp. HMF5848]|uniref:Tad domain-containing protein n=1 Tax=Bacillus sp. HMF5848 TaxID=2495421 RepID=UPI000F77AF61|nr:Tad domain-containing protein [Bacillus sp. HMF5848]RSK26373.1 hypothetical protein EJF36_05595 [Bacillus sp. HMF5848]